MRLLVVVMVATAAHAQGVRLTRIPGKIILPTVAGQNLIIEVEVLGKPSAVWLSTAAAAVDSVPLTPAGKGRYQLNLHDRRVMSLLPADQDTGDSEDRGQTRCMSAEAQRHTTPRYFVFGAEMLPRLTSGPMPMGARCSHPSL